MAVDTETGHLNEGGSALWPDSGARLSTISVAWIPPEIARHPNPEILRHTVKTGEGVQVRAFPFAQGVRYGPDNVMLKPGQQPDLLNTPSDNPNLGPQEYNRLMLWLRQGFRLVFHNAKFDNPVLRYWPLGWRDSVERCPIHGKLVSWKEKIPADVATWTPSVIEMAFANNASMKTTARADQKQAGGGELPAERVSFSTTADSAPAVGKRGARSSSSITSTAMGQFIEPRSGQANSGTEQGTPPTGGSRLTGILPGSKSYARIATALKSVLRGAHPVTDCTCVMQGELPDLNVLRYEPLGWSPEHAPGVDLLDHTYWDTQVTAPVFWPRETTSLKPTSARLWGEDEMAEVEALKPYLGPKTDPAYDLVPWDVIGPYAAKDANLTIRLAYHQWALLGRWWGERDERLIGQATREIDVMKILYRMERAGIPYDARGSTRAAAILGGQISAVEAKLPFRPTNLQAKQFFFSDRPVVKDGEATPSLDLMPYSVTGKGNAQLTAEVVQRLIKDYSETTRAGAVARLWEHRAKLNTAISMWYLPYAQGVGSDGRLRTCFRQVARGRGTEDGGTRSGRFSVERVNLQAIPHDYRLDASSWGVPTPRELIGRAAASVPGYELWEFDLAQAELRVAAAWARCRRMLAAIEEGRDLHGETTMELWPGMTKESSEWGFYRQLGKRANFTLCFGAGGETFGKMISKETGVILSSDESSTIVSKWNGIYPEFRRAIERWSRYVEEHRQVPLASRDGFATGRPRVFRRDEDDHKAFNQIVQGSLAEFLKDWLIEVQGICDEEGLGYVDGVGYTGLLLTIHDSIVVLLPEGEDGKRIARRIRDCAADLWVLYFGTPDPLQRVDTMSGEAEAKLW